MQRFKAWFQLSKISPISRGDTILEVVIATAILSTMMIATFDILQRALDTNINVKNRIIALNIAREGVEAVRNIRDTNWLKYSGERREKWLCMDSPTEDCNGAFLQSDLINDGDAGDIDFYTVEYDSGDSRFYLELASAQDVLDFEDAISDAEYRIYQETRTSDNTRFYTHKPIDNVETPFYRQIQLTILNPYEGNTDVMNNRPTECDTDTDESCIKGRLNVVSRVFWQEEGRTRSITLETNLFDFFERDAY